MINACLQLLHTSTTIWTNSVGSTQRAPGLTPPTTTQSPCGTWDARSVRQTQRSYASEVSSVRGFTLSDSFPPSGAELPDSLQRNADQPGSLSAKRFLRLHPQTRIYEKPVLSVRSHQAEPRALAQEEDFSRHGEMTRTRPFGVACTAPCPSSSD